MCDDLWVIGRASHWLIFRQTSLAIIIKLMLIAYFVNSICGLFLIHKRLVSKHASDTGDVEYLELLQHSWPIFFSVLTMFIVTGADLWILSAFRTAEEVGLYGAALRLVTFTSMPLALLNNVVSPLIIRLNLREEKTRMEQLLRVTSSIASLPALVILGIYIGYGDYLLQWIFGDYYSAAHPMPPIQY